MPEAEDQISKMEDRMAEITRAEKGKKKKKRMKLNEDSLRDLWDKINHTNIRIITVSQMPRWMSYKLKSRLLGEISTISVMQMVQL